MTEQLETVELVWPAQDYLPGYIHALEQGWSPDTLRSEMAQEQLLHITEDPENFISLQIDRDGKGPPIILPDGRAMRRLPGYTQWIWDGEFCGSINFRWEPGTTELPPYCLGHIGYSIVPWKRRRGYATRALKLLLPQAEKEGLLFVEITTDADNLPSRRVIETNGGKLVEQFCAYDGVERLRFRVFFAGEDGHA
jgi:predicted acetyltransferase